MKKVSAILVILTILFSIVSPSRVYANTDANVKLDQAIDIAKKTLNISPVGYDFTSAYQNLPGGKNVWILEWNLKKGTEGYIKVAIDADKGNILNMKQWSSQSSTLENTRGDSKDQAQKIALDYLKKMMKEEFAEIALFENFQGKIGPNNTDVYCFKFIRLVNKVPFPENGVIISIDRNTLKVSSYDCYWDNKETLPLTNPISVEEAKQSFKDNSGIELTYTLTFDSNSGEYKPILVYALKNENSTIDAVTGAMLNAECSIPLFNYFSKDIKAPTNDSSFSALDSKNLPDVITKAINQKQAMDKVKSFISFKEGFNPDNPSTAYMQINQSDNTAKWFVSWKYANKENNSYGYVGAEVDALSSQIKSFSIYGSEYDLNKDSEPKYSKEQALEKADNFLKRIEPDKFNQIKYRDCDNFFEKTSAGYKFTYIGMVNGIPAPFNNLNVYVNAYTGEIVQYSINWRDLDTPLTENIMSMDEAYGTLYSKLGYSLKYIKLKDQVNSNRYIIVPVYNLDSTFTMMDAKTGDMLEYDGNTLMLRN
jgi:hypothetical protein